MLPCKISVDELVQHLNESTNKRYGDIFETGSIDDAKLEDYLKGKDIELVYKIGYMRALIDQYGLRTIPPSALSSVFYGFRDYSGVDDVNKLIESVMSLFRSCVNPIEVEKTVSYLVNNHNHDFDGPEKVETLGVLVRNLLDEPELPKELYTNVLLHLYDQFPTEQFTAKKVERYQKVAIGLAAIIYRCRGEYNYARSDVLEIFNLLSTSAESIFKPDLISDLDKIINSSKDYNVSLDSTKTLMQTLNELFHEWSEDYDIAEATVDLMGLISSKSAAYISSDLTSYKEVHQDLDARSLIKAYSESLPITRGYIQRFIEPIRDLIHR